MTAPADTSAALGLAELETSPGFLLQLALVSYVEALKTELPEGTPLSNVEYAILVAIDENPGALQGEIGDLLHISRAHMTKMITRLETAGLVSRAIPPENRRALRLSLTETGQTALADMRAIAPGAGLSALSMLSPGERQTLIGLLRRIAGRPDPAQDI